MSAYEPNKLLNYNEDSIIGELKRVYINFFKDKQMTQREFNLHSRVSSYTVIRHFGTWDNALKKAEIPLSVKTRKARISLLEIKSDLERVKNINQGNYFSYLFYKQNGGKYDKKIKKRFGCVTWEQLLKKELGVSKAKRIIVLKQQRQFLSQDELFSEIKKVWNKFDRRPTYNEFRENSQIGISVFETRFGKWTIAIEQFCLSNKNYNSNPTGMSFKVTKELLIQDLQKIKETYNPEALKFKDYKKYGGNYTKMTFLKYFSSWKSALQSVNIKPGGEWNKSPEKELLFDELQRVWEHLGRQPLYKEWNELSKYSREVYDRKFGGWNKAIHAFIADREKPEEEIVINNSKTENEIPIDNVVEIVNPENSNIVETIIMKTPRSVPPKLRFRVFMRDHFTCQYCKRTKEEDGVKLQADHIIAYSNGGETVFENLITACWDCNIGKSNMTL